MILRFWTDSIRSFFQKFEGVSVQVQISLEGSISDVEEFSLLADVSKFTSYLISKISGSKVRCTAVKQDTVSLVIIEKIE